METTISSRSRWHTGTHIKAKACLAMQGEGAASSLHQKELLAYRYNLFFHMGGSINGGTPKWFVCKGKPIKMDDLGVPLFQETSIYVCSIHMYCTV